MTEADIINNSLAFFANNKPDKARKLLRKLKCPDDKYHQVLYMKGVLYKLRDSVTAKKYLLAAANAQPNNVAYLFEAGLFYYEQSDFIQACKFFSELIKYDDSNSDVYEKLCFCYKTQGLYPAAIEAGQRALLLHPDNIEAHKNLAITWMVIGEQTKALHHFNTALSIDPNNVDTQLKIASTWLAAGDAQSAQADYLAITQKHPLMGEPYRILSTLLKFDSCENELIHNIDKNIKQKKLSSTDKAQMLFAKAKLLEDCGEYEAAFTTVDEANKLVNVPEEFSTEQLNEYADKLIAFFNQETFSKHHNTGLTDNKPIFIIGMPRSGTTLIESILDTHSLVHAAGELPWFSAQMENIENRFTGITAFPDCTKQFTTSQIHELATEYLALLNFFSETSTRVIDKNPMNFFYIGLIRIFFPNAKIIHVKRNALDCCISNYMHYFPDSLMFTNNLENLSAVYDVYQKLMSHWDECLPENFILNISYEQLIDNQEASTRKLLEFIDLPWEQQCLNFHNSKRMINTASNLAVKKKIYKNSVNRWKNYEKFLAKVPAMKRLID